jgi:hypothetical protein
MSAAPFESVLVIVGRNGPPLGHRARPGQPPSLAFGSLRALRACAQLLRLRSTIS